MAALKKLKDPYPHKWDVTISIPYLIEKYKDIEAGTHLESELVSIAGRVKNKRTGGEEWPYSMPLKLLKVLCAPTCMPCHVTRPPISKKV